MGWSYGWKSKEELVAYLTKGHPREFVPVCSGVSRSHWYHKDVLASTVAGKELWMVVRYANEYAADATAPVSETKTETIIVVCLLDKAPDDGKWGYKDMAEAEGPYYYGCPKKFLPLAPVANEKWRAALLTAHAKKAVKVAVGDALVLVTGCKPDRLEVVSVSPLRGKDAGGVVFKVPRKMIDRVEKPATVTAA